MNQSPHALLRDRDWLYEQYIVKVRSSSDIAREVGCHWSAVVRALARLGIPKRKRTSKYPLLNDKEWLRKVYVEGGLSTREIGKVVGGAAGGVVYSALVANNIPLRTDSEGLAQKYPSGRNGSLAANWQGGENEQKTGYIYIYSPDHPRATKAGYVFKHILIAEGKIGRYLAKGEVVHHIDANKENNDPDNLLVCTRSEHVKIHMRAVKENVQLRKRIAELEKELEKH
jgi:HNH endonuclease